MKMFLAGPKKKGVLVKTEELIVVSLYLTRIEANFLTPQFSMFFMVEVLAEATFKK